MKVVEDVKVTKKQKLQQQMQGVIEELENLAVDHAVMTKKYTHLERERDMLLARIRATEQQAVESEVQHARQREDDDLVRRLRREVAESAAQTLILTTRVTQAREALAASHRRINVLEAALAERTDAIELAAHYASIDEECQTDPLPPPPPPPVPLGTSPLCQSSHPRPLRVGSISEAGTASTTDCGLSDTPSNPGAVLSPELPTPGTTTRHGSTSAWSAEVNSERATSALSFSHSVSSDGDVREFGPTEGETLDESLSLSLFSGASLSRMRGDWDTVMSPLAIESRPLPPSTDSSPAESDAEPVEVEEEGEEAKAVEEAVAAANKEEEEAHADEVKVEAEAEAVSKVETESNVEVVVEPTVEPKAEPEAKVEPAKPVTPHRVAFARRKRPSDRAEPLRAMRELAMEGACCTKYPRYPNGKAERRYIRYQNQIFSWSRDKESPTSCIDLRHVKKIVPGALSPSFWHGTTTSPSVETPHLSFSIVLMNNLTIDICCLTRQTFISFFIVLRADLISTLEKVDTAERWTRMGWGKLLWWLCLNHISYLAAREETTFRHYLLHRALIYQPVELGSPIGHIRSQSFTASFTLDDSDPETPDYRRSMRTSAGHRIANAIISSVRSSAGSMLVD
ncbi:Chromosome partition protein Smc [Carpediemonas membranifera]|uniref:Chromosome partition protein Smc n=1 Tax=Carpediemonas membranifera TaxID=201153 RepID=A0A8J6B7U8_9EUKA|nr:Chromosome partition protein Smc [Carpediemonas membranifera]|eukprot:KAG9394949.1 Chromosome partition protein Smc [Carpediemonas membranifera]